MKHPIFEKYLTWLPNETPFVTEKNEICISDDSILKQQVRLMFPKRSKNSRLRRYPANNKRAFFE